MVKRNRRRQDLGIINRPDPMRSFLTCSGVIFALSAFTYNGLTAQAFSLSSPPLPRQSVAEQSSSLFAIRNKRRTGSGADIEQEEDASLTTPTSPSKTKLPPTPKINEIDYCIAPADASLARASEETDSLTRTLNNASNRVVRRILLLLSWPGDADSLNRRLGSTSTRTESAYMADQIAAFVQRYGTVTGYAYAQDYLECILGLAMQSATDTSSTTPSPAAKVLQAGIYDEAYQRVLTVLARAGVVHRKSKSTSTAGKEDVPLLVVSDMELRDLDICWSLWDKVQMQKEEKDKKHNLLQGEMTTNGPASTDGESKPMKNKKRSFLLRKPLSPKGILSSSEEPTITRQLNVISNIVQRALLFGGDEELLFWIDVLQEDRPTFIDRWGSDTPGLSYLDALVALLQACSKDRCLTTLEPLVPLDSNSYANAYERLVATAIESGSGYWKPASPDMIPPPRTPKEELGRFALWETRLRQETTPSNNPDDLVGTWQVRDEVGGETIGTCTVEFRPDGKVEAAPLQGLRWQLDPGPTHLDTCTFQVLTSDGNLLVYRGFLDRGARWEARYSKRSLRIRGSVMFQMRDGGGAGVDYYNDMVLPINYRSGTTKFSMTKTVTE